MLIEVDKLKEFDEIYLKAVASLLDDDKKYDSTMPKERFFVSAYADFLGDPKLMIDKDVYLSVIKAMKEHGFVVEKGDNDRELVNNDDGLEGVANIAASKDVEDVLTRYVEVAFEPDLVKRALAIILMHKEMIELVKQRKKK